jgi:hypothetical protein
MAYPKKPLTKKYDGNDEPINQFSFPGIDQDEVVEPPLLLYVEVHSQVFLLKEVTPDKVEELEGQILSCSK